MYIPEYLFQILFDRAFRAKCFFLFRYQIIFCKGDSCKLSANLITFTYIEAITGILKNIILFVTKN